MEIKDFGFVHMIDNEKLIRKIFTRDNYSKEFQALYDAYVESFESFDEVYKKTSDSENLVREIVQKMIAHEKDKTDHLKSKLKQNHQIADDSMYVALFVVPAIDYFHADSTDCLADVLVEEWRRNFPDNPISRADFESLNSGFRPKKGLFGLFAPRE